MKKEMSINEASLELGITRQTLGNYIKRGLIRSRRAFNGRVFLNKEDVLNLSKEGAKHGK